jgi:hypothetical protein
MTWYDNYEGLMTAEELAGVIVQENSMTILNPTTQKPIVRYTLRYVLWNFVKMSNGCSTIAEVHQGGLSKPTQIIISNMPEAEQLVGMMNKNLPAFLFHTLQEQGLPNDFIDSLLRNSCEGTMFPVNWVLTTEDDLLIKRRQRLLKELHGFEMSSGFWARMQGTRKSIWHQTLSLTWMMLDCKRPFMIVTRRLTQIRGLQGL